MSDKERDFEAARARHNQTIREAVQSSAYAPISAGGAAVGNMNNAGTPGAAPNKPHQDYNTREINRTMDNMLSSVVLLELEAHLETHREHYGRGGWFNPRICGSSDLTENLRHAVLSDDYLSVIAYASFLLMREKLGIDGLNKKPIGE